MLPHQPNPEMVRFYEENIAPILLPYLGNPGFCRFPELQLQFAGDQVTILRIYGLALHFSLNDNPPKHSAGETGALPFGCSTEENRPTIIIFVSEVKRMWDYLKAQKPLTFLQNFEVSIALGVGHEMDHLVLKTFASQERDLKEIAKMEGITHARTCENTLRVLVETHGVELLDSDREIYEQWVRCGRNKKSKEWKNFIAALYSTIKTR